jgi:hypothetical protein
MMLAEMKGKPVARNLHIDRGVLVKAEFTLKPRNLTWNSCAFSSEKMRKTGTALPKSIAMISPLTTVRSPVAPQRQSRYGRGA